MKRITKKITALLLTIVVALPYQAFPAVLPYMPETNQIITATPAYSLPELSGLSFSSDNPFEFTFLIDKGNMPLTKEKLRISVERMGKYFLGALTIPEKDLWVNLSPYEQDRISTDDLAVTDLGKDMLGEDYVLKQLVSSVTYPESDAGKKFWGDIYRKVYQKSGNVNIPVSAFHKVWIMPDKIKIIETSNRVIVKESRLKVMMEEDYLALSKNSKGKSQNNGVADKISTQAMRETIIPIIEQEVNTGKHFAHLRQIYKSIILATWFKEKLMKSILGQVYFDKKKVKGADVDDPAIRQKIYNEYTKAFRNGVYNYIRHDKDPGNSLRTIKRQYVSGGIVGRVNLDEPGVRNPVSDAAMDQEVAAKTTTAGQRLVPLDRNEQDIVAPAGRSAPSASPAYIGPPKGTLLAASAPVHFDAQTKEVFDRMEVRAIDALVGNLFGARDKPADRAAFREVVAQGIRRFLGSSGDFARQYAILNEMVVNMAYFSDAQLFGSTRLRLPGISRFMDARQVAESMRKAQRFIDVANAVGRALTEMTSKDIPEKILTPSQKAAIWQAYNVEADEDIGENYPSKKVTEQRRLLRDSTPQFSSAEIYALTDNASAEPGILSRIAAEAGEGHIRYIEGQIVIVLKREGVQNLDRYADSIYWMAAKIHAAQKAAGTGQVVLDRSDLNPAIAKYFDDVTAGELGKGGAVTPRRALQAVSLHASDIGAILAQAPEGFDQRIFDQLQVNGFVTPVEGKPGVYLFLSDPNRNIRGNLQFVGRAIGTDREVYKGALAWYRGQNGPDQDVRLAQAAREREARLAESNAGIAQNRARYMQVRLAKAKQLQDDSETAREVKKIIQERLAWVVALIGRVDGNGSEIGAGKIIHKTITSEGTRYRADFNLGLGATKAGQRLLQEYPTLEGAVRMLLVGAMQNSATQRALYTRLGLLKCNDTASLYEASSSAGGKVTYTSLQAALDDINGDLMADAIVTQQRNVTALNNYVDPTGFGLIFGHLDAEGRIIPGSLKDNSYNDPLAGSPGFEIAFSPKAPAGTIKYSIRTVTGGVTAPLLTALVQLNEANGVRDYLALAVQMAKESRLKTMEADDAIGGIVYNIAREFRRYDVEPTDYCDQIQAAAEKIRKAQIGSNGGVVSADLSGLRDINSRLRDVFPDGWAGIVQGGVSVRDDGRGSSAQKAANALGKLGVKSIEQARKVLDAKKRGEELYRGGPTGAAVDRVSQDSTLGDGVYLTDEKSAGKYAKIRADTGDSGEVKAAYVLGNILDISETNLLPRDLALKWLSVLKELGLDGTKPWWTSNSARRIHQYLKQALDTTGATYSVKEVISSLNPYFSKFMQEQGYDGMKAREGGEPIGEANDSFTHTSIVVFDPANVIPAERVENLTSDEIAAINGQNDGSSGKQNTGGLDFAGTDQMENAVQGNGVKFSADKAMDYLLNGKVAGFRLATTKLTL